MSGYEEQLHARAEMLEETGELATAVTVILTFASGAGVDPRAVVSLRAAARALDPAGGVPGHQAGSSADPHPGGGYGSDGEFLEAAVDAEDQIRDWLRDTEQLQEQVIAALDRAQADLERAQRDLETARQALAGAYAMSTKDPCNGCHSAKAAAIAAAEAAIADAEERIRDATRRISICEDTTEILDPLIRRLQGALQALRQVPHDLGEVYELVYEFIRSGGKMPRLGRWIEGSSARLPARQPGYRTGPSAAVRCCGPATAPCTAVPAASRPMPPPAPPATNNSATYSASSVALTADSPYSVSASTAESLADLSRALLRASCGGMPGSSHPQRPAASRQ